MAVLINIVAVDKKVTFTKCLASFNHRSNGGAEGNFR